MFTQSDIAQFAAMRKDIENVCIRSKIVNIEKFDQKSHDTFTNIEHCYMLVYSNDIGDPLAIRALFAMNRLVYSVIGMFSHYDDTKLEKWYDFMYNKAVELKSINDHI